VLAIVCDWRLRRMIRANLEAMGLAVREAVSGGHGLRVLREARPDLVLLDLETPDMEAEQLLTSLSAYYSEDPVPIVTISSEPASRGLSQHSSVSGSLRKPFAASALLREVGRALEQ